MRRLHAPWECEGRPPSESAGRAANGATRVSRGFDRICHGLAARWSRGGRSVCTQPLGEAVFEGERLSHRQVPFASCRAGGPAWLAYLRVKGPLREPTQSSQSQLRSAMRGVHDRPDSAWRARSSNRFPSPDHGSEPADQSAVRRSREPGDADGREPAASPDWRRSRSATSGGAPDRAGGRACARRLAKLQRRPHPPIPGRRRQQGRPGPCRC
jgi:hypothetical protein